MKKIAFSLAALSLAIAALASCGDPASSESSSSSSSSQVPSSSVISSEVTPSSSSSSQAPSSSETSSSEEKSTLPSSSETSSSEEESTFSTEEESSSESSLSSESESSEPVTYFEVRFIISAGQVNSVKVISGENVARPDDPTLEGYIFKGWYIDPDCTIPFDFDEPVLSDMDVYAKWRAAGDFSDFDDRFVSNYSPFQFTGTAIIGDENPTLNFTCDSIPFSSSISANQIRLGGVFADLSVDSVSVEGTSITVETQGKLTKGTGLVTFARELTSYDLFFSTSVEVDQEFSYISPLSFGYALEDYKGVISCRLEVGGEKFANPDNLSSVDYAAKLQSGEYPYLSLENANGTTMEVTGVSEDFSSIGLKFKLQGGFNNEVFENLKGLNLAVSSDLFESGHEYGFPLDFTAHQTFTDLSVYQANPNLFKGLAKIRLANMGVGDDFRQYKDRFLADGARKNSLVKIEGYDVYVTDYSVIDDQNFEVKFSVAAGSIEATSATIDLNPVSVPYTGTMYLAKMGWSDDDVVPEIETTPIKYALSAEALGSVSQSEAPSYGSVRAVVQSESTKAHQGEDLGDLPALMKGATALAKIGVGLFSGKTDIAKNAIGDYLGIDSLRNPNTVILESLQAIMGELKVIESKLDGITQQLNAMQAELENLGKISMFNSFMSAHSAWTDFITDYYTPLTDQINSYTSNYFRYFYDFVKSSSRSQGHPALTITLHYDTDGKLAFPDESGSLSLDGRNIDPSATKTIVIPELFFALNGIEENGNSAYLDIEEDIIADLANTLHPDDELLSEIIQAIRFQAVQSYFSEASIMDGFINAFNNFCRSLTGTQLVTAMNPLDSFELMLESIYNFGFEAEPEMNLALIKLTATFHTARAITDYLSLIDKASAITVDSNAELLKKVEDELSSERFFHRNDANGNPYCFATGCYTSVSLNTYSLMWWDCDDGCWSRMYVNNTSEWNAPEVSSVSSISEADVRFMALKVRLLNSVKHTNYSFEEYFIRIGVIPDNYKGRVLGVILSIDSLLEDKDDIEDLTYPCNLTTEIKTGYTGTTQGPYPNAADPHDLDGTWSYAIKGWMYYFGDGNCYNSILAVDAWRHYMGYDDPVSYVGQVNYFGSGRSGWDVPVENENGTCIYAYYINIAPIQ